LNSVKNSPASEAIEESWTRRGKSWLLDHSTSSECWTEKVDSDMTLYVVLQEASLSMIWASRN
jgi:hypothetical protein